MLESCALTVSSKALPAKPLMSNVVLTLPLAGVEPGIDTVAMLPEMDALLLLGVQERDGMATSAFAAHSAANADVASEQWRRMDFMLETSKKPCNFVGNAIASRTETHI